MQDELPVEQLSEDKVDKNSSDGSASTSSTDTTGFEFPQYPTKTFNKGIAFVSVLAAVGLFLSGRLDLGVSLKDLSAAALPYEQVYLLEFTFLNDLTLFITFDTS